LEATEDSEDNDVNTKVESQGVLPVSENHKKVADEPSKIVAEEWVLLVDNLKRLTSKSGSPISSLELLDKVDKKRQEQITENPFADQTRISLDGFKLSQPNDSKDPNGDVVISKKNVEQTMSENADLEEGVDNELVLVTNAQAQQNIAKLVDKALSEVLTEELPKAAVTQETAKLLLQQPDVIHELMSQLQDTNQRSDISEKNTLDSAIDTSNKKGSVLENQQLEKVAQVDLAKDSNIELLRVLMVETDAETNNTKVAIKLGETDLSDTTGKLVQSPQAEVGINKAEPVVDSPELIDQEIQIAQVVSRSQFEVNNTANTVINNDIKSLLNLSDSKLDKVLENIVRRVFESNNAEASVSPEQVALQVITPKAAEIVNSIESSSKDFISVLKSGLEELKNQLSQGREPGVDLKALVAEALAKTTDSTPATVAKTPVNPEQIVNSVSQVFSLAQSMNRTIEERHDQMYSATLRDVAQVQGEQTKQFQINQVESKFEKAINMAKPEGHQQLAEKVRWMVNTKNLVAEIRLDPAELGSVHVKVAMSGESATVNFVVQSQQARDAVDTATPRLREMLAEKGIELGQSSVREESDGQQGQGEFAGQGGRGHDESENLEVSEQVIAQQNIVNGALGGIDYFV
jgi:flagellar hook-length control protein FliK